jgi:hypothetical protein
MEVKEEEEEEKKEGRGGGGGGDEGGGGGGEIIGGGGGGGRGGGGRGREEEEEAQHLRDINFWQTLHGIPDDKPHLRSKKKFSGRVEEECHYYYYCFTLCIQIHDLSNT